MLCFWKPVTRKLCTALIRHSFSDYICDQKGTFYECYILHFQSVEKATEPFESPSSLRIKYDALQNIESFLSPVLKRAQSPLPSSFQQKDEDILESMDRKESWFGSIWNIARKISLLEHFSWVVINTHSCSLKMTAFWIRQTNFCLTSKVFLN